MEIAALLLLFSIIDLVAENALRDAEDDGTKAFAEIALYSNETASVDVKRTIVVEEYLPE